MTKTTKRITFYSAIVIFAVLSYFVSLYAQGYRYDFSKKIFVRTGAIYIQANTDADVFLNNKLIGHTTFLGNSYLIKNLLPGLHDVRLSKNNFSQWQKKILVEEGLVNEFSRVLLVSESNEDVVSLKSEIEKMLYPKVKKDDPIISGAVKPNGTPEPFVGDRFFVKNKILYGNFDSEPEKIAGNILGFSLFDDDKLAWWNANELWVMWLSDAGYQPHKKKNDKELITRFSAKIKAAAWFKGGDHLVVDASDGLNKAYEIVEIDKRGGINIIEI